MQILGRIVTPNLASAPSGPSPGEMYYDTSLNQLLYWNGTSWVSGGSSGGGGGGGGTYEWAPVGSIMSWSRKTLPSGFVLADGAVYAESVYPDACNIAAVEVAAGNPLWTVQGTAPGRTFTVPNLTDRFIYSRAPANMGASGGEANHALTNAEMAAHWHSVRSLITQRPSDGATGYDLPQAYTSNSGPDGAHWEGPYSAYMGGATFPTGQSIYATMVHSRLATDGGANGAGHNNLPPYVVVAQIVKLSGTTQTGTGTAEVNVSPNGPSPRVGELMWVDTDANDYVLAPATVVTSLPTAPWDGQEIVYRFAQNVLPANAYVLNWRLRWDAARAVWLPQGAQEPVQAFDAVSRSQANGIGWAAVTGVPLMAAPPLKGTYRLEFGAGFAYTNITGNLYVGLSVEGNWPSAGTTQPSSGAFGVAGSGVSTTYTNAMGRYLAVLTQLSLAAGIVWGSFCSVSATEVFANRYVELHPREITP